MKPYRSMTEEPEFWYWVVDTVQGLSGIRPKHLCGPEWKPVLTYAESGSGSCQVVRTVNLQPNYSASMRSSEEVTAYVCEEKKNSGGQ